MRQSFWFRGFATATRVKSCFYVVCPMLVLNGYGGEIASPEVKDSRLELRLIAAEPDIVTPVGVAIDKSNRVYVVESHTHFPATNYPGPKTDRIKVFSAEKDAKPAVFAEGF